MGFRRRFCLIHGKSCWQVFLKLPWSGHCRRHGTHLPPLFIAIGCSMSCRRRRMCPHSQPWKPSMEMSSENDLHCRRKKGRHVSKEVSFLFSTVQKEKSIGHRPETAVSGSII